MKDLFNPHLFCWYHFNVPVDKTAKIFDLMLAKGDLPESKKLRRPAARAYKDVDLSQFMESKVIPENLLDATLMVTGEWYYTRYSAWFDDFLRRVFQLCREECGPYRSLDSFPCSSILNENPGAFFFLKRVDAYRCLRDRAGIRSNVSEICKFGHIEPLLFLLNYADAHFEKLYLKTRQPRSETYFHQNVTNRHSDEFIFHIGLHI